MTSKETPLHNVLVIAYYFPPMGLSGVQRTLKFVKYLPHFGWQPTVLSVTPTGYFAQDDALLSELDGLGITIARSGSWDANRVFKSKGTIRMPSERMRKILTFLSDTFFIPDNKIGWRRKALRVARDLMKERHFDVIVATAPPFTDFLIGAQLHDEFGTPLVLDYRDPWLDYPTKYYPTPWHKRRNYALERKVLKASSKIITTNRRVKEMILQQHNFLGHDEIAIVPQGFDAMDFQSPLSPARSGRFRITHAGVFYGDRTPKYFLQALRLVFDQSEEMRANIEANFVGHFPREYEKQIRALNLQDNVVLKGYLSHPDCVNELRSSDLLWGMMLNDTQSPGKFYEYIGARKPILACVPDGFIKQTVLETGAGKAVDPTDVNGIADAIKDFYTLYRESRLPVPDEDVVRKYDRRFLTEELSKILGFQIDLTVAPRNESLAMDSAQ